MSSENTLCISSHLNSIETDFESTRVLNDELIKNFFAELMKFENGSSAIKELTWMFGLGEKDRHIVEHSSHSSKECRKVFLIDFKQCRKYLNKFLSSQDWTPIEVESDDKNKALKRHSEVMMRSGRAHANRKEREFRTQKSHWIIKNVWVTNAKIISLVWFTVERLSLSELTIFLSDAHVWRTLNSFYCLKDFILKMFRVNKLNANLGFVLILMIFSSSFKMFYYFS